MSSARLYPFDERATPINDFCRCLQKEFLEVRQKQ
jgi:hypothetical protein